jgi:hypothetical protein
VGFTKIKEFPFVGDTEVGKVLDLAKETAPDWKYDLETTVNKLVPRDEIVSMQPWADAATVEKYQKTPGDKDPLALHHDGLYYIVNGTHRAIAKIRNGDNEVPLRVVDLDKTKRSDATFNEADHPRASDGKFGSGGGSSKSIDYKSLKRIGPQLGSNPGGRFATPEGKSFYVKQSKSNDHAKNEVTAARLYELAGSPVLRSEPVEMPGGKLGTATEWKDVKNIDRKSPAEVKEAQKDFATHAWLANWDSVGLGYDNQGKIGGKMTTLDVGGSLLYRAQGAPKGDAFGTSAKEWDSLRDPSNRQAYRIFGDMSPEALRESARRVAAVPDEAIRRVVEESGPGSESQKKALADLLIARKTDIAKRAGLGATRSDAEFKEEDHPRDEDGKFAHAASVKAHEATNSVIAAPTPESHHAAREAHNEAAEAQRKAGKSLGIHNHYAAAMRHELARDSHEDWGDKRLTPKRVAELTENANEALNASTKAISETKAKPAEAKPEPRSVAAGTFPSKGRITTEEANAPEFDKSMAAVESEIFDSLSDSGKTALEIYKSSEFGKVNSAVIRNADWNARISKNYNVTVKDVVSGIRSAVNGSSFPVDIPLYRGLYGTDLVDLIGTNDPIEAVGRTFENKGFTSTSRDPSISKGFGDLVLSFDLPAGSSALPIGGQIGGEYTHHLKRQKELLLPDHVKFKIDRVEKDGKKTWVYVTYLGVDDKRSDAATVPEGKIRVKSPSGVIRDMIREGGHTEGEIFDASGLPEEKRHHVRWHRDDLRRRGENPPLFAEKEADAMPLDPAKLDAAIAKADALGARMDTLLKSRKTK